ncbi:hypothetical protein N7517_011545 [Penicillium concentricum]|uniref:DUF7580 domain-containing protein n=1 Tax=Penicillium concentricum TaxID=293559 RepID=A0A9W9UW46_9EURO|nr:uncharacterized protein N7517_011545 [Penicillium concentricum]KAJ5356936.1 hypothetical protein N7517_011545 [Penicillium concentricum]
MASGIEVAGLTLAVIPLLVNQIDGYARGIEKIRLMRNYHRELLTYHTGLNTQYAILQCTLEDVLENVVDDEEEVDGLIQNPQGAGWKDPRLQKALQRKLGRNYAPFLGNMNSLFELLERLSRKLELPTNSSTNFRSFWKFWKILSRAVYDDLLERIEAANTILKTLIDQANHQERRQRQKPWNGLLRRYELERKHIESLFQTVGSSCWQCHCREHHCVHLHLKPYLADSRKGRSWAASSCFDFTFSNIHTISQPGVWDWRDVTLEPQVIDGWWETRSTRDSTPTLAEKARRHQIPDLCSSLQDFEPLCQIKSTIGFISANSNSRYRYIMHAVERLERDSLKQTLRETLTSLSRRDRLYIAATIAYSVLQYHGNWLEGQWDSSNFRLATKSLNSLYLSSPISTPGNLKGSPTLSSSEKRESVLQSLGVSLVELSLGRPLDVLLSSKDESQDGKKTIIDSALRLTKEVRLESGWHYASVVDSCLSWSGVSTICQESHSFEERIFDKIVSPLLKDVMIFDGMA